MKKKVFLVMVLSVLMVVTFSGCGLLKKNKNEEDNSKYALNLGETKSINDTIEITIKSNKAVNQIDPANPSGIYTYYKAGDGNKYIDVIADIKNISSEAITMGDVATPKLEMNGEKYEVFYMAEESNGTRINAYASSKKIEANETVTYHIAGKVKKTDLEKASSAKLIMKINSKEYTYNMNIVNGENTDENETSTIYLVNKGKEIKDNELVAVDNSCEFTVKSYEFKSKIEPANPTGIYHYLNAGSSNVYLNVKVSVKNTQAQAVKQDSLLGTITAVYDNEKEYKCQKVTVNENNTDINTYTNTKDIDAGATMEYYILAKVPEEAQNSTKPLYVQFSINGKNYAYKIR